MKGKVLFTEFFTRRQTRTHCCSLCFLGEQTGKRLLWTQIVPEINQKRFFCLGHKFFVRNKCYTRGKRGNIYVPKHVSAFATRLYDQRDL